MIFRRKNFPEEDFDQLHGPEALIIRRLKKRIARRLRFKRMERRKKGLGEGEVRGERQEKGKRRRTEVKPLKPRKQRKLRPPRKRRRNRKKT